MRLFSTTREGTDDPVSKFYTFSQNNSGGQMRHDARAGIASYVIIEAVGYKNANWQAEDIGLYFDGTSDCSCCGNRWHKHYDDTEADDTPSIYGEPVASSEAGDFIYGEPNQASVFVHYLDGTIEGWI